MNRFKTVGLSMLVVLFAASASAQGGAPIPVLSLEPQNMFVGYTSSVYDGNFDSANTLNWLSGSERGDELCQIDFPTAFMCSSVVSFSSLEARTDAFNAMPATGAWAAGASSCISNNSQWTTNSSGVDGAVWQKLTTILQYVSSGSSAAPSCNTTRPIMCCQLGFPDTVFVPEPGLYPSLALGSVLLSMLGRS